MKKKIVSMLLVAAMVASMAVGCGSKNDSGNSDTKSDKGESITFMAPDWAIPSDDQLDEFTKETGIECYHCEFNHLLTWLTMSHIASGK